LPAANLLLALCVFAPAASAFIVDSNTSVNDTFTVSWNLQAGATDPNGNTNVTGFDLTGTALFEFLGSSGHTMDFALTLRNTSAPNNREIGLQKFGFATEPDAVVSTWDKSANDISGSDQDKIETMDNNVSNEINNAAGGNGNTSIIEVQATAGNGANRTLQSGEFDAFNFTLTYSELVLADGVSFTPFAVKYQTSKGSYEFTGGDTPSEGPGVPIPGTLALLGLGLVLSRRWLSPQHAS
jgi:hypothetical protein